MINRPVVRVYVDETGDRGTSTKSSRFFAFAAVVVPDECDSDLRVAVQRLRVAFRVPAGKPLHWKDHVKTFSRRQHVTTTLAALPNVRVIYVVVEKAAVSVSLLNDQVKFYNYAAGLVLERALLSAKHDWPGGPREAVVRFGHVKGFDHTTTSTYFQVKEAQAPACMPWGLLTKPPTFEGQALWDGLQAADQYAGVLSAALNVDPYGGYEPQHLLRVRHQLRRGPAGQAEGYGWKAWLAPSSLDAYPWWPEGGL